MPVLNVEKLIDNRVRAIRKYHQEAGIKRAQLDVSGGIDSAVMLGLLAKALGPDNITAVYSNINSSEDSRERAVLVADWFGVNLCCIDITNYFESIVQEIFFSMDRARYSLEEIHDRCDEDPTIVGSIRSCIRAPLGRAFNRMSGGGIRHGTGNECEDRWLRFYQKGGDGEVDTNPLAMLSKGEVYQLAIGLGVPDRILQAVPSPDLQARGSDHNDEDELKRLTGVDWTYSKVYLKDDPEKGIKRGDYAYVGTIEKMSRLLDHNQGRILTDTSSFSAYSRGMKAIKDGGSLWLALEYFGNNWVHYVESAVKIESTTRHKWNPNCPSLGTREDLLAEGILTNTLPSL